MESEWFHLQEVLKGDRNSFSKIKEPFFLRLVNVLDDPFAGSSDKYKALQDALRCAMVHGVEEQALKLSNLDSSDSELAKFGLRLEPLLKRFVLIERSLSDAEVDVYKRVQRRHLKETKFDVSLSRLLNGYSSYNGLGQQTAVRVVLTSPEDSTLIINLPTGCGKTLIAHSLALKTSPVFLILVIVPTVGLAIEQSLRMKEVLNNAGQDHGGAYAWYGNQNKEERQQIRERLNNSTQRILFCSPESVTKALLPTLFNVASRGNLAAVVVDEAHLITQWGGEFRPEFQLIAPLIHSLQSVSKSGIRKILMSATFTPHTLQVLRDQFVTSGNEAIEVHGGFLRPEPSYSLIKTNVHEHQNKVLDEILNLPRPLIVYATKVDDAIQWAAKLKMKKFSRVGLFHGGTDTNERERIIDLWRDDKIDIVIATSAFGVGMDKSDVRSVLHIAVPENIDRYYQEAGRGGRDGKASLAVLTYYEAQISTAESIIQEKLISTELGLERWSAMSRDAEEDAKGFLAVDLSTQRLGVLFNSDQNRSWNWRTLLLMQRSGFIRLHFAKPELPEKEDLISDKDYQSEVDGYFESYFNRVKVEILHDGHLNQVAWDAKVGEQRYREKNARYRGFAELSRWIMNPQIPLCEILRSFYTNEFSQPELACGGCPGCQKIGRGLLTPTLGNSKTVSGWIKKQKRLLQMPDNNLLKVYYSEQGSLSAILSQWKVLIDHLLQTRTIQVIRARRDVLKLLDSMLPIGANYFWCSFEEFEENSLWAELTLLMPDDAYLSDLSVGNLRIIIAPKELKDPNLPYRRWWECDENSMAMEHFRRRVINVDN